MRQGEARLEFSDQGEGAGDGVGLDVAHHLLRRLAEDVVAARAEVAGDPRRHGLVEADLHPAREEAHHAR